MESSQPERERQSSQTSQTESPTTDCPHPTLISAVCGECHRELTDDELGIAIENLVNEVEQRIVHVLASYTVALLQGFGVDVSSIETVIGKQTSPFLGM